MAKTTVLLPEDLRKRARSIARSRGLSLGGFVRDALERAIEEDESRAGDDPFFEPVPLPVGAAEGPSDGSENHDSYFARAASKTGKP